ncbi:hypothetical protein GON26_13560 [Flavobacterium sp. GA093]|uniref:Uncharacterized protein n=2 Tax=Flavobacterium hydrocarbonoxydans TaxID=2683249 RepID=A0A6I4NMP7_9FLAO|nr:hypothetical protein [Flavobacterium hydrocarbonoxydans]
MNAQNNNELSLKILNQNISNTNDMLLVVEIENLSDKTLVLPICTNSLSVYEFQQGYKNIVTSSGSVEQILLEVRIKDENDNFITQVPSKGSLDITEDDLFDNIQFETEEYNYNLIEKAYRKLGFNENQKWLLELNFLRENLKEIPPKSKIKLNYVFNLTKIPIYEYYHPDIANPFLGGFDIQKKGFSFYLELNLEREFLKPYFQKMEEKKIIKKEDEIFYGKMVSNKILIEVN